MYNVQVIVKRTRRLNYSFSFTIALFCKQIPAKFSPRSSLHSHPNLNLFQVTTLILSYKRIVYSNNIFDRLKLFLFEIFVTKTGLKLVKLMKQRQFWPWQEHFKLIRSHT